MMDRSDLKRKIPTGFRKVIASRAGVSLSAVSRFVNGKSNNYKVEIEILKLLAELSDEKRLLLNKII